MMKRMAIGITHPPGRLAEVMLRKGRDQDEMQMMTDLFIVCAAGVSCATI